MYCPQAANHSGGVFQELTRHGGPGSLENAWTFWTTRFVASIRAPKSTMGDWRSRFVESSETIGLEWHSLLRYSMISAVSPRDVFWSGGPGKAGIAPPSDGKYHEVSSRRGGPLRRLEYRGYDSVGVAVQTARGEVARLQTPGRIAVLDRLTRTRWATHGSVTEANAHRHANCTKRIPERKGGHNHATD
jgi:hypothetical protein